MRTIKRVVESAFLTFAAATLAVTSCAKVVTVFSGEAYLRVHDTFLRFMTVRSVLMVGAVVEALTLGLLLSLTSRTAKLMWLLWLCSVLFVYRVGRWIAVESEPCRCLGFFGDVLGLGQGDADRVSLGLLGAMGLGAGVLLWLRLRPLKQYESSNPQERER